MTSTAKDRLFEVYETYRLAKERRDLDWRDATTLTQVQKIQKNVVNLETTYLKAAASALDANGAAIEEAYYEAKQARQTVEDAYDKAKALPERIRTVSDAARSVAKLVKNASAKL